MNAIGVGNSFGGVTLKVGLFIAMYLDQGIETSQDSTGQENTSVEVTQVGDDGAVAEAKVIFNNADGSGQETFLTSLTFNDTANTAGDITQLGRREWMWPAAVVASP